MKREIKGMLTGLGVTFRTMTKPAVTVQYPHEREDPPARARGVIALKEENCTVCMLCARSCPDWCIYIEGHKEQRPPRREGGRPRNVSVLDRFDIDYARASARQGQARRMDGRRARARAARRRRPSREEVMGVLSVSDARIVPSSEGDKE